MARRRHGGGNVALGVTGREEQQRNDDDSLGSATDQPIHTFADRGPGQLEETGLERPVRRRPSHEFGGRKKLGNPRGIAGSVAD
jgi:hypothetical protein